MGKKRVIAGEIPVMGIVVGKKIQIGDFFLSIALPQSDIDGLEVEVEDLFFMPTGSTLETAEAVWHSELSYSRKQSKVFAGIKMASAIAASGNTVQDIAGVLAMLEAIPDKK